MKIIVSHDVDHLFSKDHWLRDLIYPKHIVRSVLQAAIKEISWRECLLRCRSCFQKERHRISQVMDFDQAHGGPSTFFFGMNQGLGMSYYPEEAKETILDVYNKGFAVGVHGIVYDNLEGIKKEYDKFVQTTGFQPCGIRMHYVRYDEKTFEREDKTGYLFDSSEFNKAENGTIKSPYLVGKMWEFPLAIMDGYLPQNFAEAKQETLKRLEACRAAGLEYVTVLFHDYQFDEAYSDIRDWYVWLIESIEQSESDSFISFVDAIRELEN